LLRPFVAAFAQSVPVVIDFGLRLAGHHKRNCLGEFEMRPAVERSKFLTLAEIAPFAGQRGSSRNVVDKTSAPTIDCA
jgi:hypothetical protein